MSQSPVPPRKAYIRRQKEDHGRRLFGVFPAQYPREILWAMNILPVEIWDPPLETAQSNAHLQTYICSVVKLGLELILQGHCDDLDGFLFPHTCDSVQNLASIVNDYLGLEIPCHFFYHPKAPYRESSRRYYKEQLLAFAAGLEKRFGPLDPSELKRCVDLSRQINRTVREVYDLRAGGALGASNEEFYRTLRLGEFLQPEEFLDQLERFKGRFKGNQAEGPGVIISGVLPNPPEILTLLDQLGVRVVDDDFINGSRRLLAPADDRSDPFESMTESYFRMPPCSTKDSPIGERLRYILEKADRSGARGVIFYMVKFCEPELFDVPLLVQGLKERGLAALVVDVELNRGVSGQLSTRLEAFAEMID